MNNNGIFNNIEGDYPDYLRDESRQTGLAEGISFPSDEGDLRKILKIAEESDWPVTIQGARTGITGGAVPGGGLVLNLSKMNGISSLRHDSKRSGYFLSVQPGVLLSEVRDYIKSNQKEAGRKMLFFPPDPTELSASIGGMVACNASGARSFCYGSTRNWINRMRVVLADGDVLELERGKQKSAGRRFSLRAESGRLIEGVLPSYIMPKVKNAAGYYVHDDMDMIDLFIGAEGTLGIIVEIELGLKFLPPALWGVVAFLPSDEAAVDFVQRLRCKDQRPAALEYFDSHALDMLRLQRKNNPSFGALPDIPSEWGAAVYVEYHGRTEDEVESAVLSMSELMQECGGGEDDTWMASDEKELDRLKLFRHAVPESVNLMIDQRRKKEPGLTKLGTDLAVPDKALGEIMEMYRIDLASAGLEYVVFGHIGDNHVHVNIIPDTVDDYERGKKLYLEWAEKVVALGGTVSAEHGIGKLKTAMLEVMYGKEAVAEMRCLKMLFDPDERLNRGNLFEASGR